MKMKLSEMKPSLSWRILVLLQVFMRSSQTSAAANYSQETDKLALIEIKNQISLDPYGILSSWNYSRSHCQWQGVTCSSQHQRVTALNLAGWRFAGSISPHIGNLSFLRFISLQDNEFYGEIPQEMGRLFRLRYLNLTNNTMTGEIPANLSLCSEMRVIDLQTNNFSGRIPSNIGLLTKLQTLILARNAITGEFPHSIGNLSALKQLSVSDNNLEGRIPDEMGKLKSLTFFAIALNNLSGTIPPPVFNISSITVFSTAENQLSGRLPENIGFTLPNLRQFGIGGNKFYGTIPASFSNASQLELLDLPSSDFEGKIPTNLGNLQNLQWLNLELNHLGSNSPDDLDFVPSLTNCSNLHRLFFDGNDLGGQLPNAIGNLSNQLTLLGIGRNQISGPIPDGIENFPNLIMLGLEGNLFSGLIPDYMGKFHNLRALYLGGNQLSGRIPSSLGNLTSLFNLYMENNRLEGRIPSSLENCQNLKELDVSKNNLEGALPPEIFSIHGMSIVLNLSGNSLTGPLPIEVGKLKNINNIDFSNNKLSGEIPGSLGDCSSLEHLNLQDNFFQGSIPSNLASLRGIRYLDLSRNNLTGEIPDDLGELQALQYMNLSFNNLEGTVPTVGIFRNASIISVAENSKLCGGVPEIRLPSCHVKRKKQVGSVVVIVSLTLSALFLTFIIIIILYVSRRKKEKRIDSSKMPTSSVPFSIKNPVRISYADLLQATAEFSQGNFIGSGSFGSVYRGRLDKLGDKTVAVKVLDLEKTGASRSFKSECEAMRGIRHRNLVSLLTYCSSTDFRGHEFKALVYEFMENGNLDTWLHPEFPEMTSSGTLNLLQRLNIAIDVASALQYLHNHCDPVIVHCDLKPSNILLKSDLTAQVSDFGLARLLPKTSSNSSRMESSSIGIRGSIGYMPPEYGMGGKVSVQGDIYSYGILLLEMLTGKRPTNETFKDGFDLHKYVKTSIPEQVLKIVDRPLLANGEHDERKETKVKKHDYDGIEKENGIHSLEKCLLSILGVGLMCSARSPRDRIPMTCVTKELHLIRKAYLGVAMNRTNCMEHVINS